MALGVGVDEVVLDGNLDREDDDQDGARTWNVGAD